VGDAIPPKPIHELGDCAKHLVILQEGDASSGDKRARTEDEALLNGVRQDLSLVAQDAAINVFARDVSLHDILLLLRSPTILQKAEEGVTVCESAYSLTITSDSRFDQDWKREGVQRPGELLVGGGKQSGGVCQAVLGQDLRLRPLAFSQVEGVERRHRRESSHRP
jgi:hypothetical protein